MRSLIFAFLSTLVLALPVKGATLVDLVGDEDGFGIGTNVGDPFNFGALAFPDGDGTDEWTGPHFFFAHTFDLTGLGPLASATLEIFHGGQGQLNNTGAQVFVDGVFAGMLTRSVDFNPVPANNIALIDTFDLTPFLGLFNDGAANVSLLAPTNNDFWAVDYSKLTFSDGMGAIPLPASLPLLMAGLGLLAAARRRNRH
ncbi:VPLPA-CTERM sorting domain-containing protein [Roseovarius sp. CAU 1744]|uniref:VPLPA-CTERM sorting domain-containing protein n=1 Tax=Roseovarius sp. CAU 1744 TaxID=3140368 RepID=UPI00325B5F89